MLSLWRIARFVAAGGGSMVLDLLLQWVFLQIIGTPFWLGSALSYELALLGHFFVNSRWVFGQERSSWRQLGEFQMTALTAFAITWSISNTLRYGPLEPYFAEGAGPYLAKIAGTGVAFGWTFVSSFFWIWRPERVLAATGTTAVTGIAGTAGAVGVAEAGQPIVGGK